MHVLGRIVVCTRSCLFCLSSSATQFSVIPHHYHLITPFLGRQSHLAAAILVTVPLQPPGVNDKPRDIAEEDDDSEGSTGHHAKLVAPDVSPEKEIAQLEDEHLVEVERKLSAMLAAQTERDRRIAQLTDELAQKIVLYLNSPRQMRRKQRSGRTGAT